jgi:hypothetical protein
MAAAIAAAAASSAPAGKKLRMPNEKEFKDKMDAWAKEIETLQAEMVRAGAGVAASPGRRVAHPPHPRRRPRS